MALQNNFIFSVRNVTRYLICKIQFRGPMVNEFVIAKYVAVHSTNCSLCVHTLR